MQVLFLSGYANEAFQRHAALPDGVALLQKPFGLSELTRRVREVLDASG
jgi:DNA-binding response OmpR family regulator